MRVFNMLLYKEKAGVISKDPIWVCIDYNSWHMYNEYSLVKLIYQIITQWRHDRHLVG